MKKRINHWAGKVFNITSGIQLYLAHQWLFLKKYNKKNTASRSWTFDIWFYMKIMPHGRKCVVVNKSPPTPGLEWGLRQKKSRFSLKLPLFWINLHIHLHLKLGISCFSHILLPCPLKSFSIFFILVIKTVLFTIKSLRQTGQGLKLSSS